MTIVYNILDTVLLNGEPFDISWPQGYYMRASGENCVSGDAGSQQETRASAIGKEAGQRATYLKKIREILP